MSTVTLNTPIISIDELPPITDLQESDLLMVQRGVETHSISRRGIKVNDYNVISTVFPILSSLSLSANMFNINSYLGNLNTRTSTVETKILDKSLNLADIPDKSAARTNLGIDTVNSVIDRIYPIGAIYITTKDEIPNVTLGIGTWQRYGEGRVIVGYTSSDTDFNVINKTGGVKNIPIAGWGALQSPSNELPEPSTSGRLVTGSGRNEDGENLESLAHATVAQTNIPPYIVVYMWVRIS